MSRQPAPGPERAWEERVQRAAHPLVYPLLSRLARPVQRIPKVGVVVTDAALLRSVLLDTTSFTKTGPGSPADLWTPVLGPSVLLNMEGADHLALRRRLAPLFAPAYVDELTRQTIGPATALLTERLVAGEAVDLVAEVREASGQVISRLVGLERTTGGSIPGGEELFARVSAVTGFVRLSRPRFTPAQVRHAREVLDDLTRHARAAYRDAGTGPAADAGPTADTVPARMRELGLSEDEAMGAVGAFVLTGTETLVSYLPRMLAILADTGWLPRLAHDRSLLGPAIGEGLRVTTPSPVMLRSVAVDARVGAVAVRPGDRLVLATFLANRRAGTGAAVPFDPEANPAADLKQLWFGAGAHFCLGAPLAMAQIGLVLNAVLDAEARAPLSVTARRAQRGTLIPGYSRLVLRARRQRARR
ncbi:cytochrome P450 [Herbiconiux sp. CPCC 203407]|uniref:Cytochrome P450 n=1 Tax=Herbiconiux oxytropis TaxID=2970915 RepID=A0AA41XI61_9MICO|nr:cytochrome P450 [Herbiconiux oxytropis]MCS5721273.1 cytochrome P450 [Herbiconiux oxytropis]MCS5726288.1 cytochrome P450 [Herbiconiux oxytropis]